MSETIRVTNLEKTYDKTRIIENINITVNAGEIFGLLGANGSGKSTTIECILGTKNKDRGDVKILGMDPLAKRKQVFEQVGVQFQESSYQDKILVYELCKETSCLYHSVTDYISLLKQFGLFDLRNHLVSELSGGQKQRLFIVLALIPKPKVVFLDELTTGLDITARYSVWEHLIKLKEEGLTIFLTSHFMDEIEALCDKIAILNNGKIVFNGTVKEAISTSPYSKFEEAYIWYAESRESNAQI